MKTDIYLRDLRDVAVENIKDLHTSGILNVGIPDCTNKEQISEVINLLTDYFLNVSEKSCEAGMGSIITIGINIPIVNSLNDELDEWPMKTSSTTAILTSKHDSSIHVFFVLNQTKFENLNAAVQNKFFDKLSFDESTISFSVRYDGRKKEEIPISGSFVDGKPVIFPTNFSLVRRNKIDIQPSDVRRNSFSDDGGMPVFEITTSQSQ